MEISFKLALITLIRKVDRGGTENATTCRPVSVTGNTAKMAAEGQQRAFAGRGVHTQRARAARSCDAKGWSVTVTLRGSRSLSRLEEENHSDCDRTTAFPIHDEKPVN